MTFSTTLADEVCAGVLIIDIETRPHIVRSWGMWGQDHHPSQLVRPGGVICFAAKWYGHPKITFASDHHDGHGEMLHEAWRLLDDAEVVIGYNHVRFDVPHLNREFLLAGLSPPSPFKCIDLLRVARRVFRFPSNKLDYVSQELGVGRKIPHAGQELWNRCEAGDDAAWRTMRQYNRHDVRLTEQVYDRLRAWIPNHPNMNLYRTQRVSACHVCGSDDLEDAGFKYTQTRAYSRFRCRQCGGYSQATHHEPTRAQHRKGAT